MIIPFLIMTGASVLMAFFQLASVNMLTVIEVISSVVINVYIYICAYSLFVQFKNEKKYKFAGEV